MSLLQVVAYQFIVVSKKITEVFLQSIFKSESNKFCPFYKRVEKLRSFIQSQLSILVILMIFFILFCQLTRILFLPKFDSKVDKNCPSILAFSTAEMRIEWIDCLIEDYVIKKTVP